MKGLQCEKAGNMSCGKEGALSAVQCGGAENERMENERGAENASGLALTNGQRFFYASSFICSINNERELHNSSLICLFIVIDT